MFLGCPLTSPIANVQRFRPKLYGCWPKAYVSVRRAAGRILLIPHHSTTYYLTYKTFKTSSTSTREQRTIYYNRFRITTILLDSYFWFLLSSAYGEWYSKFAVYNYNNYYNYVLFSRPAPLILILLIILNIILYIILIVMKNKSRKSTSWVLSWWQTTEASTEIK